MRHAVPLAAALLLAAPAATQAAGPVGAPRPTVSLVAGATTYDLSGTGSAFAAGLFADYPLATLFRVEAGSGFVRYAPQGGGHASLLLPEAGLRITGTIGNLQPFAGVGGGVAIVLEGAGGTDATLHGTVGLRFLAGPGVSLRGEFRVRSVDPFHGTTADFMGGVTLAL